ncbi:MAG: pyridoxamine 5'-phosphate oxidase family protein [Eubacteriales bacterium]
MDQQNAIKLVNDIMKDSGECTLAILTQDGKPHAATRSFCAPANILGGYVSSNTSGNLAQSVMKNSAASMCIRQGNNNITLCGTVHIVEDKAKKAELWLDWFINHYKKGVDDPEYCVIEFKTENVSLWISGEVMKFDVK